MSQAKRCSFDQWIAWLFDHDVLDFEDYTASQTYWCNNSTNREIAYITQAFENAEAVFAPFSNGQLNQGLWSLVSSSSSIMTGLLEKRVTWAEVRCIFLRCI